MKKITLSILALTFAVGASAQSDTAWHHSGTAGVNLSQVSLSNWAAGGDASVAFDLSFGYSLDYGKGRSLWQNRLELAYGLSDASSTGTRKTNDKIYLSSIYGYRLSESWYASASITFNTQFADGYNYAATPAARISRFMAPGYLTAGVGATWKPEAWFTATFSPASFRWTFVEDDALSAAGAYGVDPGKHVLMEFGANVVLEANAQIMPDMMLRSRMTLFSNYLDKPQNVDVNWDNQLQMKINKWFSANLTLQMIYDDNTRVAQKDGSLKRAIQIKEVLGVGLSATF